MKCRSCEEVVPSKFAHAIQKNECPLCGGEIMPAQLKTILSGLKDLIDQAQRDEYMDEVKDWLASNYSLGVVNKNVLAGVDGNSGEAQNVKLSGPELYNKFAARAGVPGAAGGKPQPSLKSVVEEIRGRDEPMNMDADDVSEMEGLPQVEEVGDGDHNAIVEAFSQGNVGVGNTAAATTFNSERMRKLKAQSALAGDGGGAFRRG
jgi:hypothetical protein